ncbi:MAG: hypothetical protein ACTSO7_09955 [Candidatus Heimdallarchaeota archaeon]
MADVTDEKRKFSKRFIFKIYLRTGSKRISLAIISGAIIFLTITSLVMALYNYRYQSFQKFQEENTDWFNNDIISAGTNHIELGDLDYNDEFFNNFTNEFSSMITNLFPNLGIDALSAAMSAQVYTYVASLEPDPWINHEFMGLDNKTYTALNQCLIDGRMPTNASELLYTYEPAEYYSVNDTISIYSRRSHSITIANFTIVGTVVIDDEVFRNISASTDVFSWQFDEYSSYEYYKYAQFLTYYPHLIEYLNNASSYNGIITYLIDTQYDCSGLMLNNLRSYINSYPGFSHYIMSEIVGNYVQLCADLKTLFIDFGNEWVSDFSLIIAINVPLVFIIGLLFIVTLNIGSNNLTTIFRKMKLHGINYKTIRTLIFVENLIFTLVSFLLGIAIGFLVAFTTTIGITNRPTTFYAHFVQEPLLILGLGTFLFGFFSLSFFTQNAIAKKASLTTADEYQKKRRKIGALLSTNEFRLFVIALVFSLVSVILYLLLTTLGPENTFTSSFSYLTIFWFMITCSAAFLLAFVFLLIARLITLLWFFISKKMWKNRLNLFTLSVKQLSRSNGIFKLAILSSLIFGLVILPGISVVYSIPIHIETEAYYGMGQSTLAVFNWIDPENELDVIFSNMTEIEEFTELRSYTAKDDNFYGRYQRPFTIYLTSLENPMKFLSVIDIETLEDISLTVNDISALKNESNILMDKEYVRKLKLAPGDIYDTGDVALYPVNLTLINSYDNFPLTPIPKKKSFTNMDVFSFVGNNVTMREVTNAFASSTTIIQDTTKLIKPTNESVIPIIKEKLLEHDIIALTIDDLIDQLNTQMNTFSKNNLLFFIFLASFTQILISFFTGIQIYNERTRAIESMYRVGGVKRQIFGIFTIELVLVNFLPLLLTMLISLPLIRLSAYYFLDVQEKYFPIKANIPFWLFLVIFILGISLAVIGWVMALLPQIYRYKPVQQE